tara:strand:- start:346 stop:765 length:420 start_codon:yes stop_codon:yes gene_type:complete
MNRYFHSFFVLFSISLRTQSTYYVAPSSTGGNYSKNGSIGSPFVTIQYVVNQLSSGDDILNIRASSYRETITINKTGSNGNQMIIQAYENEVVNIDGTIDVTVNSLAILTVNSGVTLTVNGNLVKMENISVNGEINVNN